MTDFAYQFLAKTILSETELSKAYPSLTGLINEAMVSRSPNLYLLMIQLVHDFCGKTTLPSDKKMRREFVETVYRLVDQCLKIAHDHRANIAQWSHDKRRICFLLVTILTEHL